MTFCESGLRKNKLVQQLECLVKIGLSKNCLRVFVAGGTSGGKAGPRLAMGRGV